MPRENSFTDSEGRSLTPDIEDEETDVPRVSSPLSSPTETQRPALSVIPPSEPGNVNDSNFSYTRVAGSSPASAPAGLPPHEGLSRPTAHPFQSTGTISAGDRFRTSVRKVMAMHRSTSAISNRMGNIGAEPGVDPRRQSAFINYGHIRQKCVIEMIDYSSTNVSVGRMTNAEFVDLLRDPRASSREPWAKVRWINVGGISWDVMSALALKYDLHPLALEDVLHQRGMGRSKADYYPKHLFLRILRHSLVHEDESTIEIFDELPRSESPEPFSDRDREHEKPRFRSGGGEETDDDMTMYEDSAKASGSRRSKNSRKTSGTTLRMRSKANDIESVPPPPPRSRSSLSSITRKKRRQAAMTIEELKRGGRVPVKVAPFNIFLLRDGTVITINPASSVDFMEPISARLKQKDTTLRLSADPSLLVESLLDLIVDQALEVVDEYQGKLIQLEREVLIKPKMKTVRFLHIISGDLILHKRTLEPIRSVIYGLRRYDLDRCAALVDTSKLGSAEMPKIEGYMSHKAKIYLADVFDHMEYILASVDMFANVSENLINYTFNMTSYSTNETMRRLTLATIIFLPLTLLTGYFGMNFTQMWSVNNNSDLFFWEIAIPVMTVVITLFLWSDFERLAHYIEKRWIARKMKQGSKDD